jgi:RNA polymerase sigma factor (sigma-70 family)
VDERRDAGEPAEGEWIRALKAREAWERLHQVTLDRVFGYVSRHVARQEDAEDLTAEVFAAAVASIDHFRGEAGVFTWLIAIARRVLGRTRGDAGRTPM